MHSKFGTESAEENKKKHTHQTICNTHDAENELKERRRSESKNDCTLTESCGQTEQMNEKTIFCGSSSEVSA